MNGIQEVNGSIPSVSTIREVPIGISLIFLRIIHIYKTVISYFFYSLDIGIIDVL